MPKRRSQAASSLPAADSYLHSEAKLPLRPEVGTQAQFKQRKTPATYKYDSSLSPQLEWDGGNAARERGEALLKRIFDAQSLDEAQAAARELVGLSKPFLNWAGKGERLSFDVPTLPLFVHERLSTEAILETLKGHRRSDTTQLSLFGDPQHSVTDQVLRAYEYGDDWVNRMILGDSLVVMNSLLGYESLGGQVQMIYMDPPYGVKFGSNFQPFVRKRDVKHGDDADMTREPEMVQAYRDTWECGLHSYLTYLRDRLLLCRDLLTPSGSIFVQISDENLHHVRELMDEVFGAENFVATIAYKTAIGMTSGELDQVFDYIVWFAKAKDQIRFRRLFTPTQIGKEGASRYKHIESADGSTSRIMTSDEQDDPSRIPPGWRAFRDQGLTSRTGSETTTVPFVFKGKTYRPSSGGWRTNADGLKRLAECNRLLVTGNNLSFKKFYDDFPALALANLWADTGGGITSRSDPKIYVVQTSPTVIQRCMLMTTDPGDLVLDPTCGSGTTAYVAEQWGRRWITIDTSRVPLALARQRLLTATFPWHALRDPERGPGSGFVYKRKQNKRGEEVGGIVPHVTLKSIANNEPPQEEILVDRPEKDDSVVRVTGPFCFEATIPTPTDWDDQPTTPTVTESPGAQYASFSDRMIEVLRRSPVLRLAGNATVTLKQIRQPAKSLSLSAEALVDATAHGQKFSLADVVQETLEQDKRSLEFSTQPVAMVFGPENGAVSIRLVESAAKEAGGKHYTHLYVIGFAIEAKAREAVEHCETVFGIPATYVQATPDLLMGDLLKNLRSSQIFSVCGLPDVKIHKAGKGQVQVELVGLDVFDPVTMENRPYKGDDVPAWFLDTNYNDLCFHVDQAFFPRTSAWENLQKALKGTYADSVWDHLAGTKSAPFEPGDHKKIAVKVIDDRGNELLVVKGLT